MGTKAHEFELAKGFLFDHLDAKLEPEPDMTLVAIEKTLAHINTETKKAQRHLFDLNKQRKEQRNKLIKLKSEKKASWGM